MRAGRWYFKQNNMVGYTDTEYLKEESSEKQKQLQAFLLCI